VTVWRCAIDSRPIAVACDDTNPTRCPYVALMLVFTTLAVSAHRVSTSTSGTTRGVLASTTLTILAHLTTRRQLDDGSNDHFGHSR
jgi:hypothetical protein